VLLSSKSDKIPKVEVLIAIKDLVREIHEPKAAYAIKASQKAGSQFVIFPGYVIMVISGILTRQYVLIVF